MSLPWESDGNIVIDVKDARRLSLISKVVVKELDSCDLYEEDISIIRLVNSIEDELHIQDVGIQ